LKQIISLIIVFFSFGTISNAQESALNTNQQVLVDTISDLVKKTAPNEIKSTPVAVYLPEATDQSLEAFRNKLFEGGFTVSRDYSNANQFRVVIDGNNELVRTGRSIYSRVVSGKVTVSVYDSSDVLLWSVSSDYYYKDEVDKSAIDRLTSDWTISNFDKIEHRRSDRRILRWIQPVIITGAVATTVALLFSVRSQ